MENRYHISTGAVWNGECEAGWVEPNRRIYDYELVFFSSGNCRVMTEGKTYYCNENTAVIIPPDYEHCSVADTKCYRWCVHFDWYDDCPAHRDGRIFVYADDQDTFDHAATARPPGDPALTFPVCFKPEPELAQEIAADLRSFFHTEPDWLGRRLRRDGLFLEILGRRIGSAGEEAPPMAWNPMFWRGKRLLDRRFGESDLELRDLAAELLITPNHLNKLFRQHLRLSPRQYLQNCRLSCAENLLRNTALSVDEVAERSGFSTANYFIRFFKAKRGITPSKYRQLHFKLGDEHK